MDAEPASDQLACQRQRPVPSDNHAMNEHHRTSGTTSGLEMPAVDIPITRPGHPVLKVPPKAVHASVGFLSALVYPYP